MKPCCTKCDVTGMVYVVWDGIRGMGWYTWYVMVYVVWDGIRGMGWYTWYGMVYVVWDGICGKQVKRLNLMF